MPLRAVRCITVIHVIKVHNGFAAVSRERGRSSRYKVNASALINTFSVLFIGVISNNNNKKKQTQLNSFQSEMDERAGYFAEEDRHTRSADAHPMHACVCLCVCKTRMNPDPTGLTSTR